MRDRHRMKEKFSLTIGSAHLMAGVAVSVVFAGAAFVGGMSVEKSRSHARAGEAVVAEDPLAVLDARAQKLAEMRAADASLTFQDELTRQRHEPFYPELEAPRAAVPVGVAATASAAGSAPTPAESATPSAQLAAAGRAARIMEPPRATPSPKPAPVPTPVAEPAARAVSNDVALREALARASQQESTSKAQAPAPSPAAAAAQAGSFTLQLAASQNRDEAERLASDLRAKGYAPYIVEAQVPGKGTFFRVRMGRFPSKDAAQRYMTDLKRESDVSAFVTPAQ